VAELPESKDQPSLVDRVERPAALAEPEISPVWQSLATDPEPQAPATPQGQDQPELRRDFHDRFQRISVSSKDPISEDGKIDPKIHDQYVELAMQDEAAVKFTGGDPAKKTFIPLDEGMMLERVLRSREDKARKQTLVMQDPAWQQAQDWHKANPNGSMENMPQYFQEQVQQNAELGLRGSPQRELGRIFNALNQSYHQNVDPKGSVFTGEYTGPLMRKLYAATLPHPFDDAPWAAKVGIESALGISNFATHRLEWVSDTAQDAFYATAKISRNLFAPGTPLPDWIANQYHVGMTELVAVAKKFMFNEEIPWDEESQQVLDRRRINDRMDESWYLRLAGMMGGLHALVTTPVIGAAGMAKMAGAAAEGTQMATRGVGMLLGAKNVEQYGKLAGLLGSVLGTSAYFGIEKGIRPEGKIDEQTGQREQQMLRSTLEGTMLGPLAMVAGSLGAKASTALLKQGVPGFVAREVGATLEGLGFGVGTQIHQVVDLLRDPSKEKVDRYFEGIGMNMASMLLIKMMTGTTPMEKMHERFLQETGMEPEKWLDQAKGKEQTEQGRVQILRALSEGKAIEPTHEGMQMLLHPEEKAGIEEAARRLKESVPQEQALEKVTGQATAQVGERGVRGPENLLDRFIRFAQGRTATKQGDPLTGAGGREMLVFAGVKHEGGVLGVAPARDLKYDPKTGEPITMGVNVSQAAKYKALGWKEGQKYPEATIAAMHNHPEGSFFSEQDLATYQKLLKENPPKEGERVPFIVVGPNHVLVATKDPGAAEFDRKEVFSSYQKAWGEAHKAPPAEAMRILEARGMNKLEAVEHINAVKLGSRNDPAIRPTLERAHLEQMTQWGKEFGYDFGVYTPNEGRVLWRNYVETGKWETDPSEIPWYREAKEKAAGVMPGRFVPEGWSSVFPERPEPGKPPEPNERVAAPSAASENIAQGKYTVSNLAQDTRTEHWTMGDVLQNLPEGARLGPWRDDVAPILSKDGDYLGDVSRARGEPPEPTLEAPTLSPTEKTQLQRRFDATMFRVIGPTATPEEALGRFRQQLASGDPAVRQRLIEEFQKTDWFERTADVTGQEFPETYQGLMNSAKASGIPLGIHGPHEAGLFHEEPFEPRTLEGVESPWKQKPPLRGEFTPRAQEAEADAKIRALFHREEVVPRGTVAAFFGRFKSYLKELFSGQRKFFQDVRAARVATAETVEKLGYLQQFRKLGQFEQRFSAEKSRLENSLAAAPNVSRRRLAQALEPLLDVAKDLPPKEASLKRRQAVENVLERLYLKNFLAQAEKDPDTVLPLDLKRADVEQRLASIQLTPEEQGVEKNLHHLLDEAGDQLVRRGEQTPDTLRKDYMPHRVVDWFNYFETFTPGSTVGKLKRAFRGYTMARKGSNRMIDTSIDATFAYLTQNTKDNVVHDYITSNGRVVHDTIIQDLAARGIRTDFDNMTPPEWKAARQELDQQGIVLYNAVAGKLGKHALTEDPIGQAIYKDMEAQYGKKIPELVELGSNVRPDPQEMRFLVPREVADHWLDIRYPKKAGLSPTLDVIRREVGTWVKQPMLRGVAGLAVPARVGRNLLADPLGIFFKKPVAEFFGIVRGAMPGQEASRFARALASPEWRKGNLTASEEGLLQEYEALEGPRTGETYEYRGKEQWKTHPELSKIYPEFNNWWTKAKKVYFSNFGWVKSVEDYSEHLFRLSTWLSERSKLIQQGMDVETAQHGAHLETARQLVNYKFTTPLEATVLNTIVFPFYTWTRHQVTSLGAEALKHPLPFLGKYALLSSMPVLWNQLMAGDEESKLIQSGNRVTNYPHVILPWIKDSNGNPMVVSWEGPVDMMARFFGLGGAPSQVGDYVFGHGKADILWHDLSAGVLGKGVIGEFGSDWMAPWIRFIAGRFGYNPKYTTAGEMASQQLRQGAQLSRPVSDIVRAFDDRKSIEQRVSAMVPFFRYTEVGDAEPQSKRATAFYAGQEQHRTQKLAAEIHQYLHAFTNAMDEGKQGKAFAYVDTIWNHQANDLEGSGLTQAHVLQRMFQAYERQKMRDAYRSAPGEFGAKVFEVSDQQRAAMLLRMWEGR
jgi:hypothetical protein